MYDLRLKFWLVRDDRFIISDGRARLLRIIKDTKSLSKAAKEMGMSYRHAWGIIHRISENAGGDVVTSTRGGVHGGETELSKLGEAVLREYENRSAHLRSLFENNWKKPSVTADGIVIRNGKILLIKRKNDPFMGYHALPGGFLNHGERLEDCVVREVREETGLVTEIVDLVGIYSSPDRDPRGHFVTAVYHLRAKKGTVRAGDDASAAEWIDVDHLPEMAFDHVDIIKGFLAGSPRRLRD